MTEYTETPLNFPHICPYIIYDRKEVIRELQRTCRYYFYDACAFRKHVHMPHPEWWFEFIRKTDGIVVITRCVLMELGSKKRKLEETYIEFIQKMSSAGIKILVLYEEDLFKVLSEVFSSNSRINQYLGIAVKTVKTATGTVQRTLKWNEQLRNQVLNRSDLTDQDLYERFFSSVRSHKEREDGLGEELIAICVHLLANIPDDFKHKYVVLTEDKGAIGLLNRARKNSEQYVREKMIAVYSTSKIAQRMYIEKIITDKEQIEEVLSAGLPNPEVRIRGSEEYDLEDEFKTMTCRELAEKIVVPGAIYINY